MNEPDPSPVEALRVRLGEVAAALQGARALADARSRELQQDPTAARRKARNAATDQAELLDLQRARIEQDLAEAREVERQDRINEVLSEEGPIQQRAGAADDVVWRSLGEHEAALAAQLGCRQELRRLNMKLHQLGYEGEALQLAPRPRQPEYKRRVAALEAAYSKATHPLSVMPVRMGE
jgi:hypothetical protein